jgi:transposase-like protein/predicted RNA-binding Zn-ribbon protein involved in translation (DUF1610 family)
MADKYTRKQFQAQYPDDSACLQAILQRRYGKAESCPNCGVVGKLTRIEGRRAFACKEGCHIYPCAGTIFEHSPTPLTDWFYAIYLMTATRNGVSGKELQRQLGVTYKCAWRMGHQLRDLMSARAKAQHPGPLSGHVELDEAYIGGKLKGRRGKGAYLKNKTIILGMVERKGAFRGKIIPDERQASVFPVIKENVARGTTVSTDTHTRYWRLKMLGYEHGAVNHMKEEWKRGIHHTNTIEGFWSHLKRGIGSTHVSVSKKHLQRYVDEFAFRYNNREAPAEMFHRMLAQISRGEASS